MELLTPKVQINVSHRTNAAGEILDRSTLLNIRTDDVLEAVQLFNQLRLKMDSHSAIASAPEPESLPVNIPFPEEDEMICPICSKKLIQRRSRDGNLFIGCKGYPACRYTKQI